MPIFSPLKRKVSRISLSRSIPTPYSDELCRLSLHQVKVRFGLGIDCTGNPTTGSAPNGIALGYLSRFTTRFYADSLRPIIAKRHSYRWDDCLTPAMHASGQSHCFNSRASIESELCPKTVAGLARNSVLKLEPGILGKSSSIGYPRHQHASGQFAFDNVASSSILRSL